MHDVDLNDVPSKNPVAASRTYEGEGVIIHSGSMELNVVNPVGTRVWELVDGERPVGAIIEAVCREFDVDEEQAREDVLEFLVELEKKDLVRLNGGE
jgi:hypothetical protein